MFELTIGTTLENRRIMLDPNTSVMEAATNAEINGVGSLFLNGVKLTAEQTNKTFADLGVAAGAKATLISIVKADSAC